MANAVAAAPLLRLKGVTKRFGSVSALRDVDLEVRRGECLMLLGPNGAGKTTLLRVMASLTPPSDGTIAWDREGPARGRAAIGYVSHQSLLYPDLTGLENLRFYACLYDLDEPGEAALRMITEVGLSNARDQLVRQYSRGMKQRLTLARALLHQPDLLLLDEPFTGLDRHGSRLLTRLLSKFRKEKRTIVLITHNLGEGLDLCDRVLILSRGRIRFEADRFELGPELLEGRYFEVVEGE